MEDLTAQGSKWDALWQLRHEADALAAFQQSLEQAERAATEYSVSWRLAQLLHFRALQAIEQSNESETKEYLTKAQSHAGKASELNRFGIEGHFWLGFSQIELALFKGGLGQTLALSKASRHIERAANIDETYCFAAPLRGMGLIAHHKPLVMGGSLDRALDVYRRGLQIAPDNSSNLFEYAQTLFADQQKKAARKVFLQIISAPDDVNWRWEQQRDRKLARQQIEAMNRQNS